MSLGGLNTVVHHNIILNQKADPDFLGFGLFDFRKFSAGIRIGFDEKDLGFGIPREVGENWTVRQNLILGSEQYDVRVMRDSKNNTVNQRGRLICNESTQSNTLTGNIAPVNAPFCDDPNNPTE